MVESIISIVFSVFGVVGAYKESYCCTVLFSVFMTLTVVAEIYSSIIAPVFWFLTLLYIFVTMIAFSFARLIREQLIAEVLLPQQAFMRDYGHTYGLSWNSYQFFNRDSNQLIQMQTIELDGRRLPPYYPSPDTEEGLASGSEVLRALPPYEELPPHPPSYQESVRNSLHKTNDNNNENNTNNDYVQHI